MFENVMRFAAVCANPWGQVLIAAIGVIVAIDWAFGRRDVVYDRVHVHSRRQ